MPHFKEKEKNGCRVTTSKTDNHFNLDIAFFLSNQGKKVAMTAKKGKKGPQKAYLNVQRRCQVHVGWMKYTTVVYLLLK